MRKGQKRTGKRTGYPLNGQLKAINHPSLDPSKDPGGDPDDLFGMALDYHNQDYRRNNTPAPVTTFNGGIDQFNGNIKASRWNSAYLPIPDGEYRYAYQYDRNNWLTGADFNASGTASGSAPKDVVSTAVVGPGETLELKASNSVTLPPGFHARSGSTVTARIDASGMEVDYGDGDYDVSHIAYDANGNIRGLRRNANGGVMDDLSYTYREGTNRLDRVDDAVGASTGEDIGDQNANNYTYNAIGQLTGDASEGIGYSYTASGLVSEVTRNGQPLVKFLYNDRNHRVRKESYANGNLQRTTHYVRDVAGQVMAIYVDGALRELPIYGAGRIGVAYRNGGGHAYAYEITDHLGNVRATFSKSGNNAVLEGAQDYYPFGMPMPGRSLSDANQYRYAYQGQEKDPETGKEAFELRMYDARIGRWISPDPAHEFQSPYLAMGNDPVAYSDPRGGKIKYVVIKNKDGSLSLTIIITGKAINKSGLTDYQFQKKLKQSLIHAQNVFRSKFDKVAYGPSGNIDSAYKQVVNVQVLFHFTTINSIDALDLDDHVIGIVDNIPGGNNLAGIANIGGKATLVEADFLGGTSSVLAHEVAHWFEIMDCYNDPNCSKPRTNLMQEAQYGGNLDMGQFKSGFEIFTQDINTQGIWQDIDDFNSRFREGSFPSRELFNALFVPSSKGNSNNCGCER